MSDQRDDCTEPSTLLDLLPPPVPFALATEFRGRGPWLFSSREIDGLTLYRFHEYVAEALAGEAEDYVAVGHGGHGLNSHAITYHLVLGQLLVCAQTGWGGVYMDELEADRRARALLRRCADLLFLYEQVAAAGMLPPSPRRLVVIESDFRNVGLCQWLDHPLPTLHDDFLMPLNETVELPTTAALWHLSSERA